MHVQWNRRQLRTNRQIREVLCPHDGVDRPWLIAPVLVNYENGRFVPIWYPGPTIRECCVQDHSGFALAAWWWEVEQRFKDLRLGLSCDPDTTEQLVPQLPLIEEILRNRVPKPSAEHRSIYLEYREETGVTRRRNRGAPKCIGELGLTWPCTRADVVQRWHQLARRHHPDRGGEEAEFVAFSRAYQEALRVIDRANPRP